MAAEIAAIRGHQGVHVNYHLSALIVQVVMSTLYKGLNLGQTSELGYHNGSERL